MNEHKDLRPELRQQAGEILHRLSPSEREALLIKGWMSHDARWFMAVAREYGMEAANRLNRIAARAIGKVDAQRIVRALGLPPVTSADDYLLAQEVMIGLLGPEMLDYRVTKVGDSTFRIDVQRCFAHDNAVRAGIAEQYECGIFERIAGWLEVLGFAYEIDPPLGKCLKAQGRECGYTITLRRQAAGT